MGLILTSSRIFGYSGNLSGNSDRMHILLDELSKEFDRNQEQDAY